ncbi:MAG: hypothetical protein ACE5H5_00955 [Nitrospinota bacterium]
MVRLLQELAEWDDSDWQRLYEQGLDHLLHKDGGEFETHEP